MLLDDSINKKMQVFLNTAIKERLEKGSSDPAIAALLKCSSLAEVRNLLIGEVQKNPSLVDLINRHLKQVVVKRVKVSDFKPSKHSIEQGEVDEVTEEFRKYLEDQFKNINGGSGSLPIIELE